MMRGTGVTVLKGPVVASTSGTAGVAGSGIAPNAITSCDVGTGADGNVIVIMKGCQYSAVADAAASSFQCHVERRVSEVSEFPLSAAGTTYGTERIIASGITDDDDLALVNVHRDTENGQWAYVFTRDDNESVSDGLAEDMVVKYGTGSTNYEAIVFGLSSGNGAGTVFDFIPIDNNEFLVTYLDEYTGDGEILYGGLVLTDATVNTSSALQTLENYSASATEIYQSRAGYMDNKIFTLTVLDSGSFAL